MVNGDFKLPGSVTEIDAAWLTEALRRGGTMPQGRVANCGVTVIGEGEGFVGELGRLAVSYEGSAGPDSLIAKVPTQNPEAKAFFLMTGLYAIEGSYYRDLAGLGPIRTPRCYFNGMDLAAGRFVLLLEDLAPARIGDQVKACALADAELAVDSLAGLHAAHWNTPSLDALGWLPRLDEDNRAAMLGALLPFVWPQALERVGGLLGERARAEGSRLSTSLARLGGILAAGPRTLQHGDFRLDNMFFGLSDGSPFALVDWQACYRGRGGADLVYFLIGSLPPEDRRTWEDALIGRYLQGLRDRGVKYDVDECRRDMRAAALYQFAVTILLLSGAGDEGLPERGAVLVRQVAERTSAFFDDYDCEDLLAG